MSLINFSAITNLLRDSERAADKKQQLFKEVVLMVLARATSADTNVQAVEIATVQQVLEKVVGEKVSEADIKTAAASVVFETQTLDRYLASASRKLNTEERVVILESLRTVIKSDKHLRHFELDFFDRVANALRATPSEIAGLLSSET